MKRYLSFGLLLFSFLVLVGCNTTQNTFMSTDLTSETWMQKISTDPTRWTIGADEWFFTGEPNATESVEEQMPPSASISTTNVVVPDFTDIKIEGDYQVQIIGSNGENSVNVMGPSAEARKVVVNMAGNVLCITQLKDQPCDMRNVIVRISINQLNSLSHMGCGPVEGIHLRSTGLFVIQAGTGNMYLSGNIGMRKVVNEGGNLTIIGTNSPRLEINTAGSGVTNLSGNLNVTTINHHGMNDINIIGANSDSLFINADGGGKIGISGNVNLREVKARGDVWVLASSVNSDYTYAYANDNAVIGMMGSSQNLYVNTQQQSRFLGRFLCADSAFVRASDISHINISAKNRIFASATENASIYFFGAPEIMSQFVSGNGSVIPIWAGGAPACIMSVPMDYKGEAMREPPPPPVHIREPRPPALEPASPSPRGAGAPDDSRLEGKSSFAG